MGIKHFTKFFLIALAFQLFVIVTFPFLLYPLISRLLPEGNVGRHFLDLYLYYPFIKAVITTGGYEGESSMIWPPVFGTALGILTYSALFGLLVTFVARKHN
jgi:hypothetical protein